MPRQAKNFLVHYNPKELTPCKISHICRCDFNMPLPLSPARLNPITSWFEIWPLYGLKKMFNSILFLGLLLQGMIQSANRAIKIRTKQILLHSLTMTASLTTTTQLAHAYHTFPNNCNSTCSVNTNKVA